jgi:hypothetical protein
MDYRTAQLIIDAHVENDGEISENTMTGELLEKMQKVRCNIISVTLQHHDCDLVTP